ncbi:hypothetical protein G6F65_022305 [Rhizopus arrhizus]|nr:hypothetical protein G6F65_022305 [Rhizopus arrhizus]
MGTGVSLGRLAAHRRRHHGLPRTARAHDLNDVVDEVSVQVAVLRVLLSQAVGRQGDEYCGDAGVRDLLRPTLRRLELRPYSDGVFGAREARNRILRLGAIAAMDFYSRKVL